MTKSSFLHGRQFLSVACLIFLLLFFTPAKATQTDIPDPGASGAFGTTVTVLPNGNIVVTDPTFGATDVGAVYLYNGATLALISTLTGSTPSDQVGNSGITVLSNGNFVVRSSLWDNGAATDAGAVTWCSATTGCPGTILSGNSLIGGRTSDFVGQDSVTALTNGNYVVRSQFWDDPAGPIADVGAVTWGNGSGGTAGLLKTISLIGGTASDRVGVAPVTALTNGNYVVLSAQWNKPAPLPALTAGAVTWGNGASPGPGTVGLITSGNSLIGGTAGDNVGSGGATALTNGNYVVRSTSWDNPTGPASNAGAVTWGNGLGGTTGSVDSTNSLVGGTTNDFVGGAGVIALTNGNYVVGSNAWNKPAPSPVTVAGAVTWGNGATGFPHGTIDSTNSLIGGTPSDQVGGSAITALTNGNYVVASSNWDNPTGPITNVGAATWGNGTTGTFGTVTSSNSLIGSTMNDNVGGSGVTALANGNYVVASPSWGNVGAATWCDGTALTSSVVSSGNSLVGGTASDNVGGHGVIALTNGNYVVRSPNWDGSATNVGAVTWGNGTNGLPVGSVASGNSLVGFTMDDQVGFSNVVALTNGNYVVSSTTWDNTSPAAVDAGAATWVNGANGFPVGSVTSSNSLVGGTLNDNVGFGGVTALTNGNYVVQSNNWDKPAPGLIAEARAVTFGNGTIGTVGLITSTNSVLGTVASDISTFSFDSTRNRLFVGRSVSKIVSVLFFQTNATTSGNIDVPGTWDNGVPTALTNVIIPSPHTVTVNTASTIGSLDLALGATLTMSANLNVNGGLTLGTQIGTGANTLALSCSTAVSGAGSAVFINGNLKKDFCATGSGFSYPTGINGSSSGGAATGAFTYPVGTTANGSEYSPLDVNVTALGNNQALQTNVPSSLIVKANYGTAAPLANATTLDRYWTLTESGDLTANLVFHYLQTDADGSGTESSYRIIRVSGGTAVSFLNACPSAPCVDTAANTATINSVGSFSDWTVGEPVAPTAANGTVRGQITDTNGTPVEGAVVQLGGTQNRKFITDANGFYRFENVETGGFYTVTPSRANYAFRPSARSFSQLGETTEAAFGATLTSSTFVNPLDTPEYFVRQHYIDFLGREPDESGFNFWSDQILECATDNACIERRRENVSAAYFLSIEFQKTGGFVDAMYRASYGARPDFAQFLSDARMVGEGVVVGADNWQAMLAANKQGFAQAFVNRPAFRAAYNGLDNSQFVDTLISHTGVTFTTAEHDALTSGLSTGAMTRADVVRSIAENDRFVTAKFNEAFVMMEYFGYLRRDPDAGGYAFWLNKLGEFNGNFERAEMVKAFIVSGEFRDRFSR